MTDKTPDRIWAVFDKHEQGGLPRAYATAERTKGTEYVRADQVKELTDRLEVAEYKLDQSVNVTGLMLQRRAERAEAALAEARKVIGPFKKQAKTFHPSWENVMPFALLTASRVTLTIGHIRALVAWLQANKGEA